MPPPLVYGVVAIQKTSPISSSKARRTCRVRLEEVGKDVLDRHNVVDDGGANVVQDPPGEREEELHARLREQAGLIHVVAGVGDGRRRAVGKGHERRLPRSRASTAATRLVLFLPVEWTERERRTCEKEGLLCKETSQSRPTTLPSTWTSPACLSVVVICKLLGRIIYDVGAPIDHDIAGEPRTSRQSPRERQDALAGCNLRRVARAFWIATTPWMGAPTSQSTLPESLQITAMLKEAGLG